MWRTQRTRRATEVSLYAGLSSGQDLARRQAEADRLVDRAAARSSMAGLTLRTAMEDVQEVVVGIPADLFGQSGPLPLWDVLNKNDRLRGLGILALLGALLGAALL